MTGPSPLPDSKVRLLISSGNHIIRIGIKVITAVKDISLVSRLTAAQIIIKIYIIPDIAFLIAIIWLD